MAVHPHGRGDNFLVRTPALDGDSSPPRAWGQWGRYDHLQRLRRFTPTGVGTIAPGRRAPGCSPVHPHGRGDNVYDRRASWFWLGSPPRAWGQCCAPRACKRLRRFTPTGVGTMLEKRTSGIHRAVHPHGRGDNAGTYWLEVASGGSPPRAWGQYEGVDVGEPSTRFTPTGVGTMGATILVN